MLPHRLKESALAKITSMLGFVGGVLGTLSYIESRKNRTSSSASKTLTRKVDAAATSDAVAVDVRADIRTMTHKMLLERNPHPNAVAPDNPEERVRALRVEVHNLSRYAIKITDVKTAVVEPKLAVPSSQRWWSFVGATVQPGHNISAEVNFEQEFIEKQVGRPLVIKINVLTETEIRKDFECVFDAAKASGLHYQPDVMAPG